jgi:hypothetical protein
MKADIKDLRRFSIVLFLAFVILGLFVFWRKGEAGVVFCGVGLAVLFCGLSRAKLLIYPYKGWMTLSLMLGFVMTHLILLVMYYIVFTPIGVVMRIFGRDILLKQFDRNQKSYWIKREENAFVRERCEKMF